MPVCKFYLKGNCKYGDRCYNEHPVHSRPSNNRHDQYDNGWRDNSWGGTKHRPNQEQRYRSPMTQRTNQWHDNYSTSGPGTDSRNQRQKYNYHHTYQDSSSSDHQHGYRNTRSDQYHWSKGQKPVSGSRYDQLQDESGQESEADAMIQTVKSDIKTWAGSSMWPFSSYSFAKGHACIDGLPDVSPEEMRVIYLLHRQQYQSIWNELETNYCKRKDELFEMSDAERQTLIVQMPNRDSNPSEQLKVSLLYGTEYGFNKDQIAPSTSSFNSPATKLANPNPLPNPTTILSNSDTNKPFAANPDVNLMLNKPTLSIFGSSSASAHSNFSDASDIYTPYDDLSAHEKASFEAAKFVLGKIPTRPPPTQYCS